MNALMYVLLFSVFFLDFLAKIRWIPRMATWVPEVLALVVLAACALRIGILKRFALGKKYVYALMAYFLVLVSGILLNDLRPEVILIGLRSYAKHLPFFILPAVYEFSDKQIRKQLQTVLGLLIIQLPFALYQRTFTSKTYSGGDLVYGTLIISSILSIVLIISIGVVFALYLRGEMEIRKFIIITVCLFVPTTINSTKGTLVLLPIIIGIISLNDHKRQFFEKYRTVLKAAVIGILFVALFVPIYDHFKRGSNPEKIMDFYQKEGRVEKYLFRGAEGARGERLGRFDTIALAYRELSKDAPSLLFGLGIGNVARSYFKSGEDAGVDMEHFLPDAIALTSMFWETGVLGVALYLLVVVFVFRDCRLLARTKDYFGALALGWSGATVVLLMSLLYKNVLYFNVIDLLFWYFSGYLIARAMKLRVLSSRYALSHDGIPVLDYAAGTSRFMVAGPTGNATRAGE